MRNTHRPSSLSGRPTLVPALLACAAVTLLAGSARAQQLLVFDEMYTATAAGDFHHTAKMVATLPPNWVSPVDYSKGTAYIEHLVMDKPSKRSTTMTICFDGDLEGYGCITSKAYTEAGMHQTVVPMTKTWQYNKIAWAKKRTEFHLVVKDPALGGTPGGKPASDFVPSKMRLILSVVPPGGTYVRPAGLPPVDGAPAPADAGASDAAGPAADAAPASNDATDPGTAAPVVTPAADAATAAPTPAPATPSAPATPTSPTTKAPTAAPATEGPSPSNAGGACSMGPAGTASAAALPLLLLAGLGLFFRRRAGRK